MRKFEKSLDGVRFVYYDYDDDGIADLVTLTTDRGSVSVRLDRAFLLWRIRLDVSAWYDRTPHDTILDTWFVTPTAKQLELVSLENLERISSVEEAKKLMLSLINESFDVAIEKAHELLDAILPEKKAFVKAKKKA